MFLLLFLVVNITNVHCYEVGRYKKKKSIQHLENFLINILSYFLSAFPMPV